MKNFELNIENAIYFAGTEKFNSMRAAADKAVSDLAKGIGEGSEFTGWVTLPSRTIKEGTAKIKATAAALREKCEYVVCIGIGGSYLGAKAVIEALSDSFDWMTPATEGNPKVLFAGQNIGEDYIYDLLEKLKGHSFGIVVISKSGTTTEPAIAFRLLRDALVAEVGKAEAALRIVAITDAKKGALRTMADTEGYQTFVIPDNVGGRFSVLTPVGLLPIAIAGYDIDKLLAGAAEMEESTLLPGADNVAETYAMLRNALYGTGRNIEILANYDPRLHFIGEWWKQLYGESEGKNHKGIFPAAVDLTTDLHSMGQMIQDGERNIYETVMEVGEQRHTCRIPSDDNDLDGLNYIAGRRVDEVNKMAARGTQMAHNDGGVPVVKLHIGRLDEYCLGMLLYFFEKACGISAYVLGVNPFNQPGVEAYKKNMFKLLGKPGY
jgi:glucose-6-phosphate isomerase